MSKEIKKMKREAVGLCRVSTAEQRVDGNSLDSQQKHSYDFAHDILGTEIDKLWSLDVSSKSGKNIKRKDLLEIRQYCKEHKYIKYFIVDKVNRLMREIKMFYWFIQELEMIGVKTYFADPGQHDLNKDDSIAQLKTFLAIYEAERDNKERANTTLTRMKDRVLAGYYIFPLHQGYKRTSTKGLHEPDERFSLLQQAMRDIIAGRSTVSEAMEGLNAQGYRTPTGKSLRIDNFRKLLVDDYYAGLITVKRWDDERFKGIKGLHKPMLSVEEHRELKLIVSGKKRIFERKKDNLELPLGNIGICQCGGKLVGFYHQNGKGWRSPKYRCRSCGKQYHASKVHPSLDQVFGNISLNSSKETEIVKAFEEVWKEEEGYLQEKKRALELRLEQQKQEKNQVVRKIALSNDSELESEYKVILSEIRIQIENTEVDIAEVSKNDEDFINFTRFGLAFISEKLKVWSQLDKDNRVKCKLLAFPGEIVVNFSEKVCTPKVSIFLSLNDQNGTKKEAFRAPNSHMVEVVGVAPASNWLKTYFLQV